MPNVKGIIPPVVEEADVHAARAFVEGRAEPHQQLRVWEWLMREVCRVPADTYVEVRAAGGDQQDLIWALGRRSAGLALLDLTSDKALDLSKKSPANTPPPIEKPNILRKTRDRRKKTE